MGMCHHTDLETFYVALLDVLMTLPVFFVVLFALFVLVNGEALVVYTDPPLCTSV